MLSSPLCRREDPTGGRRNTQCVTTAAVSVSDLLPFLHRWAGRGFWKKNASIIARRASLSRLRNPNPPRPEALVIATPCDFFRALACAFAPALKRLLLSTSDDVHLLTTMFNGTTPARTLLQKYNTCWESANVAVPSNTDRTTAIQLVIYSMRHASSDSIFTLPIPMVA